MHGEYTHMPLDITGHPQEGPQQLLGGTTILFTFNIVLGLDL